MATLAALKKQMVALEAKLAKATKAEMGSAIAKVQKIMADFGLTIEHLVDGVAKPRAMAKKSASAKAASRSAPVKAAAKTKTVKPAKYKDPATGVTWTGVGRAPSWIAAATNRDEFLIHGPAVAAGAPKAASAKKTAKPIASVKRAMAAAAEKKAARKARGPKKVAAPEAAPAPAAARKAGAKKAATKKAPAKKAASKTVAKKAVSRKSAAVAGPAPSTSEASAG